MGRIRFSFLPTFFALLVIAFAVAVVMRVRSYSAGEATTSSIASERTSSRAIDAQSTTTADSDQGVLVPVPIAAATTSSSGDTEADRKRIAERQQRYNELLTASQIASTPVSASTQRPQPPPRAAITPAPQPQKPPSLLSRIVSPIAKAIGVNSGGTTATHHPDSTTVAEKQPVEKEGPKDPNSDTTPPVLGTIDFSPPLIHDGEETTLAITAIDDISGVRTISGNVVSPSGALQGFALQRDAESNRFFSRVVIPKDAAEGMWHINYLNLTDNASNSTTLSYAQGMLPASSVFRVQSSRSDSTAPTLKSVSLATPQVKAGEHGTILVTAEDDKSGVNLVSGVFISPSKFARVGFGCRQQEGTNTWSCDLMPPLNVDCGDWQLEQVQLQDKANNMAAVRSDNPLIAQVKLVISSDGCDSSPPVVQSVLLDNPRTAAPGTLNVTVQATDDNSGVSSISGHFVYTGKVAPGNQPPRLYFSCRPNGEPPVTTWTGPVAIPDKVAKGLWKLGALQVLDKANNLKLYSQNDPVVVNVAFTVQ